MTASVVNELTETNLDSVARSMLGQLFVPCGKMRCASDSRLCDATCYVAQQHCMFPHGKWRFAAIGKVEKFRKTKSMKVACVCGEVARWMACVCATNNNVNGTKRQLLLKTFLKKKKKNCLSLALTASLGQ